MNWLDIAIIAVIIIFILTGLSKGLISQVFSIAALAGGLIAGFIFYDLVGAVFIEHGVVENESIANVGGFIIAAFISYVVIQLIGWMVTKIIGTLKLDWLNRICGGLLGAVIGVIAAFLLVSALKLFYSENDPLFRNSDAYPYLEDASVVVQQMLPEDFDQSFENARELIREEGLEAAMKIKDSERVRGILNNKKEQDKPE
jgi:membrane protein required for colicin V production